MLSIPIPTDVWREAGRDPDLQRQFDRMLRAEQARYRIWRQEADRQSGVCYSGVELEPFAARSAAQLLADARAALAEQRAYRATPEGRVAKSMAECAEIATHIDVLVGQVRAASSRSFVGSLARIDKLLAEIDGKRNDLRTSIRDAQMAVDDAYGAGESANERSPMLLLAAEIVGQNVVPLRGRS